MTVMPRYIAAGRCSCYYNIIDRTFGRMMNHWT